MTASLREHLRDERIWAIAARVALHDGESSHHQVTSEGAIMVSVLTLRHGVPVWALMKGGDISGNGVWKIPAIGTEVIVNFDDGEFEGDAFIVGFHGKPPSNLAMNETQIVDTMVYVGQKTGAEKMVKGETYRSAEDTMLDVLKALCTALGTSGPTLGTVPQQAASLAAATAAATAITTFQSSASSYLAQKGKVF